ncbi:MAG: PQQ-binding-like beta-propeller repeat protein [Oscillospiraceae bacterium]|jgi:outer membrane protein assembly factor BamB|nr:PQQ-binding-like beta-propeller repeat protein [Oscillospiraceae bacterium]
MPENNENKQDSGKKPSTASKALLLAALLLTLSYLVWRNSGDPSMAAGPPAFPGASQELFSPSPNPGGSTDPTLPTVPIEPLPDFAPRAVAATQPSNFLSSTGVQVDGADVMSYIAAAEDTIDFGFGRDYTAMEGVLTFRGNNFRDSPTYGTANLSSFTLTEKWSVNTGALGAPDGSVWTGSGWVGQPLIIKWPAETRRMMNLYDRAKAKENLVEVIYATMDGSVYFLDLETGEYTRDPLDLGFTFKGSGALDPRGYPILYLGSGYDSYQGRSRVFIINLIDCSTMYQFGHSDPYALRGASYFDGSPLVDAETDQLIYPGENGILYIIKLNTVFDPAEGALSISPSKVVKWRYNGVRTTSGSFWLGMEDSAIIFRGHIIMSDNGGNLMCLNLNTLDIVWVQDVLDDTNCTPVLELENGHPYVYTSTSFHAGWRAYETSAAPIPIWKIDALTGEIVWQTDYDCYTVSGTSGGVQGTLAMGKNNLSDLIFVPVARNPYPGSGLIVALDKATGQEVWRQESSAYSWSSPVIVYDSKGDGYVLYCTTGGYMYLFDGRTGRELDNINLLTNMEASPAVYNNTIVIGTRGQKIYGVSLG